MREAVLDVRRRIARHPPGDDVVLCYDGTSTARAALSAALEQAESFGGRLLIVFGVEPPGPRASEGFKEHRRALRELARKHTAWAAAEARAAGLKTEVLLVPRRQASAVLEVARRRDARMVVVGVRDEGPLKAAIVGSVAHRLLGRCEAPVLVVRDPK